MKIGNGIQKFKIAVLVEAIDQAIFSHESYRAEAHDYLAIPYFQHGCKEAYCQCTDNPRRLEIIKRKDSELLFLRMVKGDRENHHPLCGIRLKGEGVDEYCSMPDYKIDNGILEIAATISLQDKPPEEKPSSGQNEKKKGNLVNIWKIPNKKSSGLGGLMNRIINSANLNYWNDGEVRTHEEYISKISDVCKKIRIRGVELGGRICIGKPAKNQPFNQRDLVNYEQDEFLQKLADSSKKNRATSRGILFDQITKIEGDEFSKKLKLDFLETHIEFSVDRASSLKKSYQQEWASVGKKNRHVFGMFLVSTNEDGTMKVEDAALFLTNSTYFNVDSGPEADMVDYLIQNGRSFKKLYREWNESGFIPDFQFLDTFDECILEVWGMNTEEYKIQKQKKIDYYKKGKVKLTEWDATKCELHLVKLPEKKQ